MDLGSMGLPPCSTTTMVSVCQKNVSVSFNLCRVILCTSTNDAKNDIEISLK